MILISHRGNLNGKSDRENQPEYINEALDQGFDVEVDVWYIDNQFWLGHDKPQYKVSDGFLEHPNLWCHAKNLAALDAMLYNNIHCFWHETDQFTITSKGYIWTFPGEMVSDRSVIVHKGNDWTGKYNCFAVCTDYISS